MECTLRHKGLGCKKEEAGHQVRRKGHLHPQLPVLQKLVHLLQAPGAHILQPLLHRLHQEGHRPPAAYVNWADVPTLTLTTGSEGGGGGGERGGVPNSTNLPARLRDVKRIFSCARSSSGFRCNHFPWVLKERSALLESMCDVVSWRRLRLHTHQFVPTLFKRDPEPHTSTFIQNIHCSSSEVCSGGNNKLPLQTQLM